MLLEAVRGDRRRSEPLDLGAAEAIDPEGFEERGPFDVVLELVGAPNLRGNLKALATNGRIAVIGMSAGVKAEINLIALTAARGKLMGSTLRARPLEEKALAMRLVERHVLPLVESGQVEVPVADTFPLDEVERAYERFSGGGKVGKVVLTF